MYKDKDVYDKILDILKKRFGEVEDSIEYLFDFTDYYEQETGRNLNKKLLAFKELIDRNLLAEIKEWTNELENKFSAKGKRKINIDPGYITEHNVVLASAKEMPHRIYLSRGIFGDVVLIYRKKNKTFQDSEHTFPDYKTEKVKKFLIKVRGTYRKQKE